MTNRPSPARRRRSASAADHTTATIAAGIFAALGICAHQDLLADVNWRVRGLMLRRDQRTARLARVITTLSESAVHPALAWVASKRGSRAMDHDTYAPLIASLCVFALNKGTRLVVHQQRPPGAKQRTGLNRLGYPSGHTLAATAIAFTTALEIGEGRSRARRTALLTAAAAYAATIGWTRLALDEHWIDDVVGAWAGGIALAIVVHRGHAAWRDAKPRIRRRKRTRT